MSGHKYFRQESLTVVVARNNVLALNFFSKVACLKHLENLGLGTCFQQESVRSVFQEDQTLENVLNRKM